MKKLISAGLICTVLFLSAACGAKTNGTAQDDSLESQTQPVMAKEGSTVNIWCRDRDFEKLFARYYPDVKNSDNDTVELKDGTKVKFTVCDMDSADYQKKLDEALSSQEEKDEDERIDLFIAEQGYVKKYTDADTPVTQTMEELGITEQNLKDQFACTRDLVRDSDGNQRAAACTVNTGLFAYRRDIAKKVLGTSNPNEVQSSLSSWSGFDEAAGKAAAKGYRMVSGYDATLLPYSAGKSGPWVKGTVLTVDAVTMQWVDQAKMYTDRGYNDRTMSGSSRWKKDMGTKSRVLGFFLNSWDVSDLLKKNSGKKGRGRWSVCYGPQAYTAGGSWICAAAGNDNPSHIKNIIMEMTCDSTVLKKIAEDKKLCTNTVSGMQELGGKDKTGTGYLKGQNLIKLGETTAAEADVSASSAYDDGCLELFAGAFRDYFDGKADLDTAKANFEVAVKDRYPEITEIRW